MRDDVAAAADHAAVPDPQRGQRAEILAGHHASGQGHLGGDEGVLADRDPAFAEHRTLREGRHRTAAERGNRRGRGVRGHHAVPLRRLEDPVHRPPAQLAQPGAAAHLLAGSGDEGEVLLAEALLAEALLAEALLAEALLA